MASTKKAEVAEVAKVVEKTQVAEKPKVAEKLKVAYLGPEGTYSHEATKGHFPEEEYLLVPMSNIEAIFGAVDAKTSHYGVVPFENSSNGPVTATVDLLADLQNRYPGIVVTEEIYLPVQHCLLGHLNPGQAIMKTELPINPSKAEGESSTASGPANLTQITAEPAVPRGKPIYDIGHVKYLLTHTQAWGQCKIFLRRYAKKAEQLDMDSTAKAAMLVSNGTTWQHAAIASKFAAKIYGLTILAEGIEDNKDNCTRFFVIRRFIDVKDLYSSITVSENVEADRYKSLVAFKVKHAEPGSLADSLAVFKKYNLNLTSSTTRPSGSPWQYVFFVEFQGRKRADGQGGVVNDALAELGGLVESYKWLGSWENQRVGSTSSQGGKANAGE